METAYFVFPDTPNWISLAFGDVSFGSNSELKTRFDNFNTIMAMLERSTGPLSAEQTKTLKELIKADPSLLGMSHGLSSDLYPPIPNPTRLSDLPMLLHQAAAGPARDKRLVEWMVQMGALNLQPTHCRNPPPSGSLLGGVNRSQLCIQLDVHSAVAAGMQEIVRILLVADHMRDLNTCTYHTKKTLVHLAVKHGYREMFTMLAWMGANMLGRDANDKHAYELTSNAKWKDEIHKIANEQARIEVEEQKRRDCDAEFVDPRGPVADRLRHKLDRQRDVEHTEDQSTGTKP